MSKSRIVAQFERGLFAARWLLAPFYAGLALALIALLAVFGVELWREATHLIEAPAERLSEGAILMALNLIDLTLSASLVVIVILSGYENFVSRIDTGRDEDRPEWMGKIDFSGLKIKLIASIVAISAISLLQTFLELGDRPVELTVVAWKVGILLTFVVSGLLLAVMDMIGSKSEPHG